MTTTHTQTPTPPILPATANTTTISITRGHQPGAIQAAISLQTHHYTRTPGFNPDYKTHLTTSLTNLEPHLLNRSTTTPEVWTAKSSNRIVGTIFVVAAGEGESTDTGDGGQRHARLTSFIVDPEFRGLGIGRRLLNEALAFIDGCGVRETRLWTFRGSDAAVGLYESVGFGVEREVGGEYFGQRLSVVLFVRRKGGGGEVGRG